MKTKKLKNPEPVPDCKFIKKQPPMFLKQNLIYDLPESTMKQDEAKCLNLLCSLQEGQREVSQKINELVQFTTQSSFQNGIKYYACKDLLFNQYLICLKFYQLFKLNGSSFTEGKGLQLYERMLTLKTLLMKLGPIQKKLQYQKDKLLKKGEKAKVKVYREEKKMDEEEQEQKEDAEPEEQQENQNPDYLVEDVDSEEEALKYKPQIGKLIKPKTYKQQREIQKLEGEKYAPPKQIANLPSGQKTKRRQQRREDRQRARLIKKVKGQLDSGDQAHQEGMQNDLDKRFMKQYENQIRKEEFSMQREQFSKKQKSWIKQMKKNQFKGSQLNDELKETEVIRKLVQKQTKNEERRPEIEHQKPKKKKKLN